MKITYDKKVDAMYIKLRKGSYDHSKIGKVKKEKVAVEFTSVSP